MRALLVVALLTLALPARTAAAPKAKKPAAGADKKPAAEKEKPAAAKGKQAEAGLSLNRVAFVQSAVGPRVPRPVALQILEVAETDIKAQGFESIGFNQVAAEHARQKKTLAACADSATCLASVGKVTGAAWVVNLSINQAPKTLGVKLTIVDAEEGKVVSNILSFVNSAEPDKLKEAVRKLVPRAITALQKASEDRKAAKAASEPVAVAVVVPKPEPEPKVEPKPEPKPEPVVVIAPLPKQEPKPLITIAVEPAPKPIADPPIVNRHATPPAGSSSSIVPWVAIGVGAVAIGVGVGVFGRQASAAVADFKAGNDAPTARATAKSKALLADVTTGIGIAGVAVGVVMLLTGGDAVPAAATSPVTSLELSPTLNGLALSGSF